MTNIEKDFRASLTECKNRMSDTMDPADYFNNHPDRYEDFVEKLFPFVRQVLNSGRNKAMIQSTHCFETEDLLSDCTMKAIKAVAKGYATRSDEDGNIKYLVAVINSSAYDQVKKLLKQINVDLEKRRKRAIGNQDKEEIIPNNEEVCHIPDYTWEQIADKGLGPENIDLEKERTELEYKILDNFLNDTSKYTKFQVISFLATQRLPFNNWVKMYEARNLADEIVDRGFNVVAEEVLQKMTRARSVNTEFVFRNSEVPTYKDITHLRKHIHDASNKCKRRLQEEEQKSYLNR